MYISYGNTRLEKICTSYTYAMRALRSDQLVRKLFQRLTELSAFDSLADVPDTLPFHRHKLKGDRRDTWAINLLGGKRICIKAVTEDGAIATEQDLKKINCIQIVEIGNYHD